MRIVKPSQNGSTHNSPLGLGLSSKAALGRRMTVMGDTSGYRRKRLLEATAAIGQQQQAQIQQNQMMQQQRPASWCPTMSSNANMGMESWNGNATQQQGEAILRRQVVQYSPESQLRLQQLQQWQQMHQLQNQQAAQQQQAMRIQQAQQIQAQRQQIQMQQLQQQQAQQEANYFALDTSNAYAGSNNATPYFSQQSTPLQFPTYSLPYDNQYYNASNSYASTPLDVPPFPQQDFGNGMYNNLCVPNSFMSASTTPPTPETFPIQDQFQTQYINDSSSSFLLDTDNQEDDSEVLVGLGLYSSPDKAVPKPVVDERLADMYRRAGVQLNSTDENTAGKGLKLEDSWAPPAEDEEANDDNDNDAEGEDEDEETSPLEHVQDQGQGLMGPPVGWL